MTAKTEQFSAINSNPVLSVAKDGVILYSNKAGEPLLHDWGVSIGEKLPLHLEIFVQRAISRKSIEKIEITMGKKIYFIVFHSLPEQECVNIYGFDISGRKKLEGKLQESETQEKANLELARIIDTKAIQSLMSDFYTLAHVPMALLDLKGNILVSVGWQEICTKFHRFYPEACKHCLESDLKLTAGVAPGGYKLYKCKNNMWDVVTPIMVEGQHVGNIFSGQFFFDDEPLNYEIFRSQARQYGFDEEEYIKALEKVPRLSRKAVDTSMAFFMTFANMISQLSYSNIKLSQSLAERDTVVDALLESEKRERDRSDELAVVLDAVPVSVYIAHDPQALQITGNRLSCEWLQVPVGTNFSKSAPEGEKSEMFKLFKDGVEIPPSKMPSQLSATGIEINDCELDIVSADGQIRHVLGNARPLRDEQGKLRGSVSAFIDITERKKIEETIRLSNLYNRSLIEASLDPLVTIGRDGKITDVNNATEKVTGYSRNELIGTDFSDYFTEPGKARAVYQQVFMRGEVRDYSLEIQHKDGYITPVLYNASVYRDENGKIIGVFAAARDITELKRVEEERKTALETLRYSEDQFRSLLQNVKVGVALIDETGRFAVVNPSLIQMFGLNNELDILNINSRDWSQWEVYGEDGKLLDVDNHPVRKAVRTGKPVKGQLVAVRNPGSNELTWLLISAEPILKEDGHIYRVICTYHDITERKRAEEALQMSEAELARAQQISQIGSWTWDLIINEIRWSEQSYRNYGLVPSEVKPSYELFLSFIVPDDRERVDREIQKAIESGHKYNITYNIIRKDGTPRILLSECEIIKDESGKVVLMYGTNQDITERKRAEDALKKARDTLEEKVKERTAELQEAYNSLKESEERLADSQKTAHIGNWDWNIVTGEEYWSDELYHIFGLDPRFELNHNIFLNRIHPDDLDYVNYATNEALNGNPYHIDYRIILPSGEERIIYSEGEVLFDEKHKPVRMSGIVQDITERKKAEESLANIEIARKKEIHHRIKNNLQVISSLLDLQAEQFRNRNDIRDSEVLKAFRESQDRVISMALIHEELYKGEKFETLNFSPYIKELANTLFQTYSLGYTEISLKMDLEENLFFDIDTAVPLGMIVNELVSNSLKHAFPDRDKGEIRIKLNRDKNEECAKSITGACKSTNFTLTVSDDGIGIPENLEIENLDSLGFQLVTSLVDQLDGEFELKRNNGTEFTMRFTVVEKR